MDFKTKKIRNHIPPHPQTPPSGVSAELTSNGSPEANHHIPEHPTQSAAPPLFSKTQKSIGLGIIGSICIIVLLGFGIVKAFSSIEFKFFLKAAGSELHTDAQGHSNFLILGIGGKNHDGADLTDTMMIASLDQDDKLISMISIPRDIFIKDKVIGNTKINEVYSNAKIYYKNSPEAMAYLENKLETMLGIQIQYYIKVDFKGFKQLVDDFGGVDVNVAKAIYDPLYPKDGTVLYDPFMISAGQHHLDGETALKYSRSRETTSDFDRARRQQQVIYALKEKAMQTDTILNADRISSILNTLKENIETNISVKEILTLGSIAADYSQNQITHRLIHDNPTQCGGFLYVPERAAYGGQFVLLPAGSLTGAANFLSMYIDLNFNFPKVAPENAKIQILNATKKGGVAGETKQILKRFCFDVVKFGNAKKQDAVQTTYYYQPKKNEKGEVIEGKDGKPAALDYLEKIIPGQVSTTIPPDYLEYFQKTDIIIELGSDYTNSDKYLDDPFYRLPMAVVKAAPAAAATSATATTGTAATTVATTTTKTSSPKK